MDRHDPIFGRRLLMHTGNKIPGDPGVKSFCKCMDCAKARHERKEKEKWDTEYKEVINDLCAPLPTAIIRDANAQKVVREITREIEQILAEYDETDSITGQLILERLKSYHRAF